jgi:hypothetical protein
MKGKNLAVYGATGALPLWTETANAIVNAQDYKEGIQPADLVFDSLSTRFPENEALHAVPVSPLTGLPLKTSKELVVSSKSTEIRADVDNQGGVWRFLRHFEPSRADQ